MLGPEEKDKQTEGIEGPKHKPAQAEAAQVEQAVGGVAAILDGRSEKGAVATEQSTDDILQAVRSAPESGDNDSVYQKWLESTNPDQRRGAYMRMHALLRPIKDAWNVLENAEDARRPKDEVDELNKRRQALEEEAGVKMDDLLKKISAVEPIVSTELLHTPEFAGMNLEEQMGYLERKAADLAQQSREAGKAGDTERSRILWDQRRLYLAAGRDLREATYRPPA